MIKRVLPFILGVAAALAASGPVQAQVQVFTDEASFLAAVAALGHPTFSEGFEGSAWDGVRTTIAGGVSSSPSVTSQGITWSSSTEVTTNNLGPRSGTWRGYDQPGGAPDTLDGLSTATLYAIGGWFVTNTPPTNLRISVGGAFVDGAVIPLTTSYQFLGVVDSAGFTTFQVYCSEGTPLDPKNWFADDFTFSTSATPVNHPPDGTIVSPAGDPTILAGQSVSFSGSVFDPDGDAVTVLWSFGDATSSTALSPGAHTYATPGSYPVSFTATDVHDLADPSPATRTVTVVAPGGVTVSPTSGLVTSESGASASFTVVLTSQPTATVTIGLSSSDTTEGTVSPTFLSFDSTTWSTPRTVSVTGVDDTVVDGDIAYSVVTAAAVSTDPAYAGLDPANVAVTNTDNDTAGITVSPASGLVTSESGASASFTVVLTSQPTATVTVGLSSSDSTEGTVSPTSVVFDSTSWSTPRTVTVTGVDDAAVDGDIAYAVLTAPAVSADATYSGLNPADVVVTNTDNDTAGITVSPFFGLVTSESGASASFTIVLATQPTTTVTVGLSSSDTSEGTVSPASVAFDSTSWSTPRTVTVTGVDDAAADGDVAYSVVTAPATSADPTYSGMNPADVAVTNTDNDSAGISVSPTSGLVTSESGASASFTVVLATRPTATVTVGLSSSDTSEGTVAPTSLTFDASTWSTPRTVTATGVDDTIVDGDVVYSIVTAPATSADPAYSGMDPVDVAVTNTDDDSAVITGSLSGVAATKGLQGSDWHTNLWIHNAGPTPARVEVHYVAKGSAPSFDAPLIVDLAAGQTAAFDDVLPLAFSRTSTSGSFLYRVVTGDARAVILRADTYNRLSSAERFGQNVPAVPAAAAAATGEVLYLPGPPDIDQYRFNVGLQSAGARHALVHVVDKASGSFLHTSTVTLDELGWVQLVDLQTSFALGRASGWYVEATGLDGPLVISGNLVDQRSNDSINIIGRTAKTDGGEVWLPGAALVAGFLGSDWHSDLFSINTSPLPTAATVSFFPRGPAHPDDVGCTAMPLELAGYEHRSSTDVLGGALGLPDGSAGALAVKQDRLHPILHTLRTYNDTVDGEGRRLTYGSATPAIPLEDFIGGGGEGRIVGITNDADTRSNLAIVNTHASASGERLPTTVDIELLDADGRAVIQDALVVKPHQNVQINKFVEHYLGPNADIADATLVVRVSGFAPGDTGGVAPIVYVVNGNRIPGVGTSDPQAVLAVRVPPTR